MERNVWCGMATVVSMSLAPWDSHGCGLARRVACYMARAMWEEKKEGESGEMRVRPRSCKDDMTTPLASHPGTAIAAFASGRLGHTAGINNHQKAHRIMTSETAEETHVMKRGNARAHASCLSRPWKRGRGGAKDVHEACKMKGLACGEDGGLLQGPRQSDKGPLAKICHALLPKNSFLFATPTRVAS